MGENGKIYEFYSSIKTQLENVRVLDIILQIYNF